MSDGILSVGNADMNNSTLTITGPGNISSELSNAGNINISPGALLEITGALTNTGSINIAGGTLQLDQGIANGTVIAQLSSGSNGGLWNGVGIVSSLAAADPHHATAVGYASTGSVYTLRYTWLGDANLDGVVNSADLAMISSAGTTWSGGVFNYDGIVNADDYALFMLGSAESGNANISTTLPEPGGWLLGIGWTILARRKKRTR